MMGSTRTPFNGECQAVEQSAHASLYLLISFYTLSVYIYHIYIKNVLLYDSMGFFVWIVDHDMQFIHSAKSQNYCRKSIDCWPIR